MRRGYRLGPLLAVPVLCLSPFVHGVIQGEPGERESTAVATITLNVAANLQITNVSDIVLDVTDRSQDVSYEERICVRGNVGGRYNVVAAGQDGSQSPFQLRSTAGDLIEYDVFFRGDLSQTTLDRLYPGEASPYYHTRTQAQDCDGDDTAAFSILFHSEDLLGAEPGVYSGSLTFTVAAE